MIIEASGTGINIAPEMKRRLKGYLKQPGQHQRSIREIGVQLHEAGGLKCMQDFYAYADLSRKQGLDVQSFWHGVGDWRY